MALQTIIDGTGQVVSGFQIINETESIIRGAGEYYGGNKRTSKDAGLNDSESDGDGKFNASADFGNGPKPGKKTRGRVKIEMKFIENKLRRYTTFSKRKTGIMKKAYELSTLTGTQVMLLVASETGHVYTFATRKLQPMITSETGKALIQTCLNSPDGGSSPPVHASSEQRMNITGYEETDLSYSLEDDRLVQAEDGTTYTIVPTSTKKKATATTTYTEENPNNGNNISSTAVAPKFVDQTISMTTLLGVPKTEKHSEMTMHLPTSTSYLLGTPQAVPANIQIDSSATALDDNRVSPVPLYRIPLSGSQITGPSTSPSPPEYTDLKPIVVPNSQAMVTHQVQQTLQAPQFQVEQQQLQTQTLQTVAQQNALQQAGLTYIPAASLPSQGLVSQSGGAIIYQTPQGMVYATAGSLAEGGLMIGLSPQTSLSLPGMSQTTDQTAATGSTQYITIPVPVSLSAGGQMPMPLVQLPLPQSQGTIQPQPVLQIQNSMFTKDDQNKTS